VIKKRKAPRRARSGLQALRTRLRAAEDTLRALRAGEVDALVATRGGTERVITLQGADLPYRMLLDQMFAGALTLTPDGVIVYCNQRFADIVRTPLARIIGSALRGFVLSSERPALEMLLARASKERVGGDLSGRTGGGTPVPIAVTFAPLRLDGGTEVGGVVGVVIDATERKRLEELRTGLIEQVMTAQEEERARIARELHDETGQSLTALLVGLRTLEQAETIADATDMARRLREIAAQTLHEVGRLSRGLHPSIIDDVGLAAAVTRHVQDFAVLHGIAADLRIDGLDGEPLPPLVQTTVYRVLQEALTNVGKHARARSVTVRLVRHDATVELLVQDDGRGFKPGGSGRLGLRGMRERAALLGGSVDVVAHPGTGTTIATRVPVRRA
jgi:PAS domain S-box-containing protein